MLEYRKLIMDACPNKTGDAYFLEKGVDEIHTRLTKKVKNIINCSHMGMVCLKGCPRAMATERSVVKDGELYNDMALLNGKVLYEVTDTRNKSLYKYDRKLAKLMVPTRRSPSGPVKGTKSLQPPNKHPSPKPQTPGMSKKATKVKTKSKKTPFVITSTTPNIPSTPSPTPITKSDNSGGITTINQHPTNRTMPSSERVTLPRRKTGWKPFGPGLRGGAPPKHSHGDKIMQEPGRKDISYTEGISI